MEYDVDDLEWFIKDCTEKVTTEWSVYVGYATMTYPDLANQILNAENVIDQYKKLAYYQSKLINNLKGE